MKAGENVPELRFPGFEDEWEEKILGDVCIINPKIDSLPDEFFYIDLESVISGSLISKKKIQLKNAPSRAQRLLNRGDVIFQMVRPYQRNNLHFNISSNIPFVASTGYAQLRANTDSRFLYQILHLDSFVAMVMDRCTGTSYPAINSSELACIGVFYPSPGEQAKIAGFLSDIDLKIAKLSRKKELMVEYKRGTMQKLFSQEIRFKDEKGEDYPDWEEKKLEEFFISRKDQGNYDNLPLYSLTIENGVVSKPDRYVREFLVKAEENAYKKVLPGDFVYNPMNLRFGALKVYKGNIPVQVSKYYDIFYTNSSTTFWEHYLTTHRSLCYYDRMATGGLVEKKRVHFSEFLKFSFKVPSFPEQTKIADFLSDLDLKIGQIDKELRAVKEYKKGLLQKMFV